MEKEQFDNQKWYKNMPVWANGQKCYVREVRFMTGEINVIYKIGATSGVTWDFCLVETSPPDPTALDLISFEATLPQITRLRLLVKAQKELIALYDEENLSDPAWLKESELRVQIKTLEQ